MVNSIKTSELISSISYNDLSDRSCCAWQELTFVRNKAKNGKSVSIEVFLELFEHVADYIECAAWEAAEKNSEAGKRLFKLHDIAKYSSRFGEKRIRRQARNSRLLIISERIFHVYHLLLLALRIGMV